MYYVVYFGHSCKPFQCIIDMQREIILNYNTNNNNDNVDDDDNNNFQSTLYNIFKNIFILCENK